MKRYPGIPAKVGTVPKLIYLRSCKPYKVGDLIEFRLGDGYKWQRGEVTSADPLKLSLL